MRTFEQKVKDKEKSYHGKICKTVQNKGMSTNVGQHIFHRLANMNNRRFVYNVLPANTDHPLHQLEPRYLQSIQNICPR